MEDFFTPLLTTEGIASLLTLTLMEVVLGIDNVVFISILSGRLPVAQRPKARNWGIGLALVMRLILLSLIAWIIDTGTQTIFSAFGMDFTVRNLILFAGGVFLLYKATKEIHHRLEGSEEEVKKGKNISFAMVIFQIILLDLVFSFDSILTAVGLVEIEMLVVMITAVIISMVVMLVFAGSISRFINKHPTVKMLALSFLLMIGMLLVLEGFNQHVEKGYIYSAIAFSLFVEILNLRARKKAKPVQLKQRYPLPEEVEEPVVDKKE